MGLESIMERYRELDDLDRQKIWVAVFFGIIILLTIYKVNSAFGSVKDTLDVGVDMASNVTNSLKNLTNKT